MIDETGKRESVNQETGNQATANQAEQGSERVGFCQDCGKPLTQETIRQVGPRTFCEPCLTTRVSAGTAYGAASVPPPPGGAAGTPGTVPPVYTEPFPPMGGNAPSPGLAALLGFIPGVGAMYNGQFAKGIAHIVIFAVLSSLAHANDFFGLLVFGFVLYQVFEAYHTAKARREGRPLPDPFGLNNIGQQVGLHMRANGMGGPRGPGQPSSPPSGSPSSYPGWTGYVPAQGPIVTPPPEDFVPPAQSWAGVPVPPPVSPYTQGVPVWDQPVWNKSAWDTPAATPPVAGAAPARASMASQVPAAAFWLIGFGALFMVLNFVPDWRFSLTKIFPFVLMAWGVGLFVRRMISTGGLTPTDSEGYAYGPRMACSLRAPVVLFTFGLLTLLQAFDVVRVGRTWPVLVIVFGLLLLLERSLGSRAAARDQAMVDGANGAGKGL